MSTYVLKAPQGRLTHALDWSKGYLVGRERITADLGWAVLPSAQCSDLRVVEQHQDPSRTTAVLAGGQRGRFYLVSNRVRTTDDRVLSQSIVVRIAKGKSAA